VPPAGDSRAHAIARRQSRTRERSERHGANEGDVEGATSPGRRKGDRWQLSPLLNVDEEDLPRIFRTPVRYHRRVSEWRTVWQVTIKFADSARYADTAVGRGYNRREITVETAIQLRKVVEWARANPQVTGFPYRRVRERVGEEPQHCRHGHGYDGGSAVRARHDWTDCICGGHFAYVCRWTDCDDIRIDPPAYDDCDTTEATLVAKARRLQWPP